MSVTVRAIRAAMDFCNTPWAEKVAQGLAPDTTPPEVLRAQGLCPASHAFYPASYPNCGDAPRTVVYCDRSSEAHAFSLGFHSGFHLESGCDMQWYDPDAKGGT